MTDAKANREARLAKPTAQPQSAQQGPKTHAAAGRAIAAVAQQQQECDVQQLALVQQQLQERDTQLAQLQDEYARLKSYMQLQQDQKQVQHATQLALMATDHVRRLDVHEESILKLQQQNAILHDELARVKGAHAFLQQQHQQLKRRWEEAEQQRSASASTSGATQGAAKRQRRAGEPLEAAGVEGVAGIKVEQFDDVTASRSGTVHLLASVHSVFDQQLPDFDPEQLLQHENPEQYMQQFLQQMEEQVQERRHAAKAMKALAKETAEVARLDLNSLAVMRRLPGPYLLTDTEANPDDQNH